MIITKSKSIDILNNLSYWAVLMVAMMGAAVTTLMPLMVGAFTDSQLFSTQQVGFLTASDVAGILIASTSAYFWVRKCHWQKLVSLSLVIFIIANVATTWVNDFYLLIAVRFVAGLACGISYSIALAALGDRKSPDKAFGDMVTIQVIYGTVGFAVLPYFIKIWGFSGVFQFFNITLIIALILTLITYPSNNKQQTNVNLTSNIHWLSASLVFSGVVFYYFAQGTIWAYLERIGVAAGLSISEIGTILGIGFAISAIGSWLSGWSVERIGRPAAIWLTVIVQLPCLLALFYMKPSNALLIYGFATIIYQIFWSYIVPIMMGIFNDVDDSGRLIVFCIAAFKVGLVIGPPVAALIISIYSLNHVIGLGAIAIVVSAIFLVQADKSVR
ncbi:MFS transporter [Colwellia sp. RSH04]|uniref:MFS transporter n=1 Tax=Colwellia sp. RSH04 TaxID=2305464 RepID=UPI000E580C67|nr:MFS transporter [Colwellia sp. RSH04]RHW76479.1 MFS transporter [Colwellia sp. RSH04]